MDVLSTTHRTDPPPGALQGLGSVLGGIGTELADPQWWRDPLSALAALERAHERRPTDRRLAAAVAWALDRIALQADAPDGLAEARPIRWDAHSAVWCGADPSGRRCMVRALRGAADPAWHRVLRREARALEGIVDVEVLDGERGPTLWTPLVGQPLADVVLAREDLARPLLTGLAALRRWERAELGLHPPAPEELRLGPDGVTVACLWPAQGSVQPALSTLAALLLRAARDRGEEEPEPGGLLLDEAGVGREGLLARLRALAEHDSTAADAGILVRAALAESLAARRHALFAAWRGTEHRARAARQLARLSRLGAALRPPPGLGAVGLDVDGEVLAVRSDGAEIRWGAGEGELLYDEAQGFRPAVARHLLRTRAARPPIDALDRSIGGDPAQTDAICRWVAAGLQLRTVRLLLQRALE
ncbi:MAG: hypothetical protein R3F59_06355 [Myxococcota bacterium]